MSLLAFCLICLSYISLSPHLINDFLVCIIITTCLRSKNHRNDALFTLFLYHDNISTDPKSDIDWKVCSSFSQIIQTHLKGFGSGIKGILMRQMKILIHIDRGMQIQIQQTKMMAMMMKMVIRWVQCLWWWNDDEMIRWH